MDSKSPATSSRSSTTSQSLDSTSTQPSSHSSQPSAETPKDAELPTQPPPQPSDHDSPHDPPPQPSSPTPLSTQQTHPNQPPEPTPKHDFTVTFTGLRPEHHTRFTNTSKQTVAEKVVHLPRFSTVMYKVDVFKKKIPPNPTTHYTGKPSVKPRASATFAEVHANAFAYAKAFMRLKTDVPKFGVMLCTDNNICAYELALGAQLSGNHAVFVDASLTPAAITQIVNEANVRVFLYDRLSVHFRAVTDMYAIMNLDADIPDALADFQNTAANVPNEEVVTFAETVAGGDIAEVVYLSAEDGHFKGVLWTHNMVVEQVTRLAAMFAVGPHTQYCEVLPQTYYLERLFALYLPLVTGHTTHVTSAVTLESELFIETIRKTHPTLLFLTPRELEKIVRYLREGVLAKVKPMVVDEARGTGLIAINALNDAQKPPKGYSRSKKKVYARCLKKLGLGGKHVCITPMLEPRLLDDAIGCGLQVYEGYAAHEMCGFALVNRPFSFSLHTSGRIVEGVVARVQDKALFLRGNTLTPGYIGREEFGNFTEDCFRTGYEIDIIDQSRPQAEKKFFVLKRRQTVKLVTSRDVLVYPEPIERAVRAIDGIEGCLLIGDGVPFVTALVTVNEDVRRVVGRDGDVEQLIKDPEWKTFLKGQIEAVNAGLPKPMTIKKFAMVSDAAGGGVRITAEMSVETRRVLIQTYDGVISAFYSPQTPPEPIKPPTSKLVREG